MAITIKNLSRPTDVASVFSDLHLDLQEKKQSTNIRNNDVVTGNDIIIDTDEDAIKNSIRNILLQRRYLTPDFGANLRAYIGQPMSDLSCRSLGGTIEKSLNIYEPRIKVDKILVAPNYDTQEYAIVIIYSFKNFKKTNIIVHAGFGIGRGDFYFIE